MCDATPLGTEFQVNTHTTGNQFTDLLASHNRSVASDSDGNFVVVWNSYDFDSQTSTIHAQRYDSAGAALGTEILLPLAAGSGTYDPSVAMDPTGDFAIAWDAGQHSHVQRFTAAGELAGQELVVNPTTLSGSTTIALDASGDLVVAWIDYSRAAIYARRYSAAGVALGSEVKVSATLVSGPSGAPLVATDETGDFVVVWAEYYGRIGVYARLFSEQGVALGAEIRVDPNPTAQHVGNPAVAMDADGDFVVAWNAAGGDSYYGNVNVVAQRFNSAGVAQGLAFRVNSATAGRHADPAIAMDADGNFVVAWYRQDGEDGYDVYARRYSQSGDVFGDVFRVNATTAFDQDRPSVAVSASGDFVVAWTSLYQDGDGLGMFAQRFELNGADVPSPIVQIDANAATSQVEPGAPVTYTLYFNVDVDPATFTADDLFNSGTAPVSIDAVTHTRQGVFTVVVTPTGAGTLNLAVRADAGIAAPSGDLIATPGTREDDATFNVGYFAPSLLRITDMVTTGSVAPGTQITYTFEFDRPISATTFDVGDLVSLGSAKVTFTSLEEADDAPHDDWSRVFTVNVTTEDVGTIVVGIAKGATITTPHGEALDTTVPLRDDTVVISAGNVVYDEQSKYTWFAVAVQPDGKIVTAGSQTTAHLAGSADYDFVVARWNANGTLDVSFGDEGYATIDVGGEGKADFAKSVAIDADGSIVVAGTAWHSHAVEPNFTRTVGYPSDGFLDGWAFAGGDFAVVRLKSTGQLDTSFGDQGRSVIDLDGTRDVVDAMALDPQGSIVLGGSSNGSRGTDPIVRLTSTGARDTTFGEEGVVSVRKYFSRLDPADLVVDAQGRIVIAGNATSMPNRIGVARLTAQGRPDSNFNGKGVIYVDVSEGGPLLLADVETAAIDARGNVVVAGMVSSRSGERTDSFVIRVNSAGRLDSTFSPGGAEGDGVLIFDLGERNGPDSVKRVLPTPNGDLLLVGEMASRDFISIDYTSARLTPAGALDRRYGVDGFLVVQGADDDLAGIYDAALDRRGNVVFVGSGRRGVLSIVPPRLAPTLEETTKLSNFSLPFFVNNPTSPTQSSSGATPAQRRGDDFDPTQRTTLHIYSVTRIGGRLHRVLVSSVAVNNENTALLGELFTSLAPGEYQVTVQDGLGERLIWEGHVNDGATATGVQRAWGQVRAWIDSHRDRRESDAFIATDDAASDPSQGAVAEVSAERATEALPE